MLYEIELVTKTLTWGARRLKNINQKFTAQG